MEEQKEAAHGTSWRELGWPGGLIIMAAVFPPGLFLATPSIWTGRVGFGEKGKPANSIFRILALIGTSYAAGFVIAYLARYYQ